MSKLLKPFRSKSSKSSSSMLSGARDSDEATLGGMKKSGSRRGLGRMALTDISNTRRRGSGADLKKKSGMMATLSSRGARIVVHHDSDATSAKSTAVGAAVKTSSTSSDASSRGIRPRLRRKAMSSTDPMLVPSADAAMPASTTSSRMPRRSASSRRASKGLLAAAPRPTLKRRVTTVGDSSEPSRTLTSGMKSLSLREAADMDIDDVDRDDPQMVSEYASDIMRHLFATERTPSPTYMSRQTDITAKFRGILIDWLVEVHLKFKLMPETLYLTVNIIDRYLERKAVRKQKLQLVGVTAMLLASKYEEIYAPEVRDFVYICNEAYNRDEILDMESRMVNVLQFNFTMPSPLPFLARFAKAGQLSSRTKQLAHYYVERMQQEYGLIRFLPSKLAAAAVYLARRSDYKEPWTAKLEHHSTYSASDLASAIDAMSNVMERVADSSLQAVRKKYTSRKFQAVATLPFAS